MRRLDPKEIQQFVRELKWLICTDMRHIRTIVDAAGQYGLNRNTLQRYWKSSGEHLPLGEYIRLVRCMMAFALHRANPDSLCKEIAASLGYRSPEAASRSFHRLTGMSIHEALHTDRAPL